MKAIVAALVFATTTLAAAPAVWAGCRISNETKWSFKIESGNTSNQSVGSHTTTTIASGKIKGVDEKSGKSVSGQCKDGDTLKIIDDKGVPVLVLK
jgi:hypothetical protein